MRNKSNKFKPMLALAAALTSLGTVHSATSLELAQTPLFLAQPVRPLVMLNMSNDHQLFFKAYDDYSDLTGDGKPDTTYVHGHQYYGYFDSGKCYVYQNNRFEPNRKTGTNGYCGRNNEWNGNFLNWATMTRMDAVRKILYGGLRSTDSSSATVLERAFLPHDAHSFAKYYNGTDIRQLTPFDVTSGLSGTAATGITICNTTDGTGLSQNVTNPPLLRVASGNNSLWASNERWQCRWGESGNDNDSSKSGIHAYDTSPRNSGSTNSGNRKLGNGDYNVRIKVCVPGLEEENCRSYPTGNTKPGGLLQKYGEKGEILFGLISGSYAKNKSGGVLRKNISDLTDEINVDTDGTFSFASSDDSIIKTLDLLRIYGYRYTGGGENGAYNDNNADNCPWGLSSFTDGRCSNWGNPQSEIYLESLRYLAGRNASAAYSANDGNYISGLTSASWKDPINNANYCAPLNIIQFNASSSSYDGDIANDLEIDVSQWTDTVGAAEGIHGNEYFVGTNGTDNNQLCTAKTVGSLASVTGTCPDAPRLEGTYKIAGLAHYARKNSIRSDFSGSQTVRTYGVALAPAVPRVEIPVPGSAERKITILPACRNHDVSNANNPTDTNCAIVDFKIVEQSFGATNTGKLYVNWEDSEQGGDFDQDMWGVIDYTVTNNTVRVTTNVIAESTSNNFKMGFGYVISGTTNDGFHAHSGINGFNTHGCNNCQLNNSASAKTYSIGTSTASPLEFPLYYAAKWGGYGDDNATAAEIAAGEPETYFFATDPAKLEEDLGKALEKVAADVGSASAVATNSTRLGTDTVVYQALFNSADWSGELKAIRLNTDGSLGTTKWSTTDQGRFTHHSFRNIVTYTGSEGVDFRWDSLSPEQRQELADGDNQLGQSRLDWLRGREVPGLRERKTPLGDIVNSNPVFAGRNSLRFDQLPADLGGPDYAAFVADKKSGRKEVLYVNANDGMLHAFDAENGSELFAYVPSAIYGKLRKLAAPNYGAPANPHAYNVDGPLFVGDAYVHGQWRSILVGTLGAGGRGIFALDVTDPDSFSAEDVLLELTENDFPQLGHVLGQPLIAPVGDSWKIVFGNGYGSEDSNAHLFLVDLEDPENKSQVIAAGNQGDNGLAAPSLLADGSGLVVSVYAGDLQGNLWKFDLSHQQPAQWNLAFRQGNARVPLFTARDASGKVQSITAAPVLGRNAQMEAGTVMVYFGTGRYLTHADNDAGDAVQSFYAIADQGEAIGTANNRAQLMEKEISFQNHERRQVEDDRETSWWSGMKGWYLDLSYNGQKTGERIVSKPLLRFDRLLFPTLITSRDPCAFGGSGWLMELVAVGDRFEGHSIFGDANTAGTVMEHAVMGFSDVITDGESLYLPTSNIKGEIEVKQGELPPGAAGRMSWRQLR